MYSGAELHELYYHSYNTYIRCHVISHCCNTFLSVHLNHKHACNIRQFRSCNISWCVLSHLLTCPVTSGDASNQTGRKSSLLSMPKSPEWSLSPSPSSPLIFSPPLPSSSPPPLPSSSPPPRPPSPGEEGSSKTGWRRPPLELRLVQFRSVECLPPWSPP